MLSPTNITKMEALVAEFAALRHQWEEQGAQVDTLEDIPQPTTAVERKRHKEALEEARDLHQQRL